MHDAEAVDAVKKRRTPARIRKGFMQPRGEQRQRAAHEYCRAQKQRNAESDFKRKQGDRVPEYP